MKKGTTIFLLLLSMLFGAYASYAGRQFAGLSQGYMLVAAFGGTLASFVALRHLWNAGRRSWRNLNAAMERTSIEGVLGGTIGLLIGITVGFILGYPFRIIPGGGYVTFFLFFAFGFIGMNIGMKRASEVVGLFPRAAIARKLSSQSGAEKVLDTSAIIDGRIYDVALSGFLEGSLLVPAFVIEELRHIADSSDYIRRSKGRRGLEILAKMQKHPSIKISIMEGDCPEEREVDMKLLRICKNLGAAIVTNDYNLNKVAELQNIKVLNVNELTNAVKVVVFPGETMKVTVIKEGKEEGQGVGYLEDGTMVVVEGGEQEIGQEVEVIVTSVFQTAAGRMIFSRKAREGMKTGHAVHKLQEVNLFG